MCKCTQRSSTKEKKLSLFVFVRSLFLAFHTFIFRLAAKQCYAPIQTLERERSDQYKHARNNHHSLLLSGCERTRENFSLAMPLSEWECVYRIATQWKTDRIKINWNCLRVEQQTLQKTYSQSALGSCVRWLYTRFHSVVFTTTTKLKFQRKHCEVFTIRQVLGNINKIQKAKEEKTTVNTNTRLSRPFVLKAHHHIGASSKISFTKTNNIFDFAKQKAITYRWMATTFDGFFLVICTPINVWKHLYWIPVTILLGDKSTIIVRL